jgi:hypothetical protein
MAYILGVGTHTVDSTTRNFLATAVAVAGVSIGGLFFLVGALSLGGLSFLGRPRGKTSLSQINLANLGNPSFRTCLRTRVSENREIHDKEKTDDFQAEKKL